MTSLTPNFNLFSCSSTTHRFLPILGLLMLLYRDITKLSDPTRSCDVAILSMKQRVPQIVHHTSSSKGRFGDVTGISLVRAKYVDEVSHLVVFWMGESSEVP